MQDLTEDPDADWDAWGDSSVETAWWRGRPFASRWLFAVRVECSRGSGCAPSTFGVRVSVFRVGVAPCILVCPTLMPALGLDFLPDNRVVLCADKGVSRPSAGPKIFNSWPLMGLMCSSPEPPPIWRTPRVGGVHVIEGSAEQPGRGRFTAEFKADAVAMVIDGERPIVDVARGLGLVEQTLGNWVRQARIDRGERAGLTSDERAELVRLRRENAQLAMERDLLKRATAFWVKESAL